MSSSLRTRPPSPPGTFPARPSNKTSRAPARSSALPHSQHVVESPARPQARGAFPPARHRQNAKNDVPFEALRDLLLRRGQQPHQQDRPQRADDSVYDALNRLAQKTYPDTTSVDYTYDLVGKVTQVNDPTGTYGFSYDNMGRLTGTSTQYAFLTGTFTNAYTYDAASNPEWTCR